MDARESMYVERICPRRSCGKSPISRLVNYHTHYLIALFYTLVLVTHPPSAPAPAPAPPSHLPLHVSVKGVSADVIVAGTTETPQTNRGDDNIRKRTASAALRPIESREIKKCHKS